MSVVCCLLFSLYLSDSVVEGLQHVVPAKSIRNKVQAMVESGAHRAVVRVFMEECPLPPVHNLSNAFKEASPRVSGATPSSSGPPTPNSSSFNGLAASVLLSPPNNNSSRWSTGSRHPVCRICLEPEPVESLFSPCKCSGSLAFVHHGCLGQWLASKPSRICEICKVQLPVRYRCRTASEVSSAEWFHFGVWFKDDLFSVSNLSSLQRGFATKTDRT